MEKFPKTLKFKVTRKDLLGEYQNSVDCPIARALKRIYANDFVNVGTHIVEITGVTYTIQNEANEKARLRSRKPLQIIFKGGFEVELTRANY